MGCDPKLSSCDSIGFVRPVSLKKNSPLIKLRVGWFSALFFGLNSLTWAWCEFALNQARLAPMPWLTLGSQARACASVRDLSSLQYLMGGGTVRCPVFALSLPSPWSPRQTLQSQKRKSWISSTRHLFWSCPEIGVPEKSDSQDKNDSKWKGWSVNLHKMLLAPVVRRTQDNVWFGRPVSHSKPS